MHHETMKNSIRRPSASAFSLIEVLIAVVVLSLGLLGLAAVFPTVLTQQRTANDGTLGASLARSAEDYLVGSALDTPSPRLDASGNPIDLTQGTYATDRRGWDVLIADTMFSQNEEWIVPGTGSLFTIDSQTGDVTIGTGGSLIGQTVKVPIADRLYPKPYSGLGSTPRMVWDFAVRRRIGSDFARLATGNGGGRTPSAFDSLQVAVFVRRIDSGIRTIGSTTLADVLTGTNLSDPMQRRVPVAQDRDGRPLNDGVGLGGSGPLNYSMVQKISYELGSYGPDGYSRIVFSSGSLLRNYANQVGQKFVDQFGVVHTVTALEIDPMNQTQVVGVYLAPPVAADINQLQHTSDGLSMLFTPQIPVAVQVFDVWR
ncbi:MAG: hypothetical protein GC200_03545 [Tepidisphaera sp.]|nr:hypothetical protein [Tepidisphaera sp.]